MQEVENKLDELLVKKAPFQLPENTRLLIVKAMPWVTLLGGVFTALAVWQLYRIATWVDTLGSYYGALSTYGYTAGAPAVSPLLWVSLLVLAVEAVLFIAAFPSLKARKKSGWNLLYWVSLLNVVYAVFYLFVQMSLVSLIGSLIGSVIGLYILFQVRTYYMGKATTTQSTPTTAPPAQTPQNK